MDIKDKALARTVAPIEKVHPNPFRNFEINSIRDDHVNKLLTSIEDIGMWSGLAARKIPDTIPAEYEIACGHHRLEAIKRAGLSNVAVDIRPYTDEQMIRIMVEENMTQRGNENAGTVLDSVAAVIVHVVKENLGDECTPDQDGNQLARIRNGKGVGVKAILKRQPTISARNARDAISILKASGKYADLIENGGALEKVINLYRADEVEAIPNALKAVTMFQKVSHGKVFIDTVREHPNACERSEDEYCNCAKSILEAKRSPTSDRVKEAVLDYFRMDHSSIAESLPAVDQDNEELVLSLATPQATGEPTESTVFAESDSNGQEKPIEHIPEPTENIPPVVKTASPDSEVSTHLEDAIHQHMKDGWNTISKTSTLDYLKKMTVEVCEDQSVEDDIPPAERYGCTIIDLLESMDKHNGRCRDRALKEIRDECDKRLKGTVSSSDAPMDLAA